MKATARKAFDHDQLGKVEKGEFTFTKDQLPTLRGLAFVEIHETKPHVESTIESKPERSAPATKGKAKAKAK